MKKEFVSYYLFGLLVLTQACQTKTEEKTIPSGSEAIPVKIKDLEQSENDAPIQLSGRFTTEDETILSFKTGGLINSILVKEGDRIRKGQLLATLKLDEINAQVSQAQLGFEKAQRDYQRAQNLYKDSVATLEQLENSKTAVNVAQEQLKAARFNQNYSEIRAPADGFVLKKFANAGQIIGPGNPVVQTNGAGNGKWILKAGLSDRQWAQVAVGNKATVSTDAQNGKRYDAVVARKSEGVDPSSGGFTIDLSIENGQGIASGMFGNAVVSSGKHSNGWSLPYQVIMEANGNNAFVFVTSDNKTARKIPVVISSFNDSTVNISSGLENAGKLIVSGSAYLSNGAAITIIK